MAPAFGLITKWIAPIAAAARSSPGPSLLKNETNLLELDVFMIIFKMIAIINAYLKGKSCAYPVQKNRKCADILINIDIFPGNCYIGASVVRNFVPVKYRRSDRVADGGGLENRCAATYRGFESLILR